MFALIFCLTQQETESLARIYANSCESTHLPVIARRNNTPSQQMELRGRGVYRFVSGGATRE